MNIDVTAIQDEIHRTAVEKGWWQEGHARNFGEALALMHSELSEALEAWRDHKPGYYRDGEKPEGWAIELIDCVIRVFDWLAFYNFDAAYLLDEKVEYNKTRPFRHGGKRA